MKRIAIITVVIVAITSSAWAGGRIQKHFNSAFGTTLGVVGGIVAVDTAVTVLRNVFGQPQTVVVQRQRYYRPRSRSTYDRAYEEEMRRLRWREFQRQQQLARQRGRNDAYRDFYSGRAW